MLKILMVTERYIPIWGGAENQLRQLIPHLLKQELDVSVVTRRWHSELKKKDSVDGVPVVRLGIPGDSAYVTVVFIFHLILYLFWSGRKFDIFHSHGAVKMGILCRFAAFFTGSKNVVKIATAGKIGQLQRGILGSVLFEIFKKSDAVICMTDEIKNELDAVAFPPKSIFRIPNAVDCHRFEKEKNEERRKEFREQHGMPGKSLAVLFSGRLVYRKGLDILIEGWSLFTRLRTDDYLLILGSGKGQPDSIEFELKKQIEATKNCNILFLGETDSPEKYLANSDIFVFPSRQEGFPNALMEAMASEMAVVATRIGGNEDLIEDRINGMLFEPEDPKGLADCLETLCKDNELASEFGTNARHLMLDMYDFKRVASSYSDLYTKLNDR